MSSPEAPRPDSPTGRFVAAIQSVRYEALPAEAVKVARQVVLDGLGVALAGADDPSGVGRTVRDYVRGLGGRGDATVIGGGFKASLPDAAFANGTMAHALDLDNTWSPMNHPTSPTLPAILAVAEKRGSTGRQIIEAIVTAFEVQARLRLAATGWRMGKGFHKPGVTGTMGATAGVGKLLGLDQRQMTMALGLAGSRAGSLSINTGTMTKPSHAGQAARSGVECAILAGMGWTASPDVFGPGGFFEAFIGGENHPELLTEGFGAPFRMVSPGVGFKKYPCSYATHRAVAGALSLRAMGEVGPADVQRLEIVSPPWEHVDRPYPANGLEGKFSVQYVAAAALLDGEVGIATFTDARRFAADMEALLGRTAVVPDASIPADMDSAYFVVRLVLRDGARREKTVRELPGWPGAPLSEAERVEKFFGCVRAALPRDRAEAVVELVDRLEGLAEVGTILDLVGGQVP